MSAGTVVWRCDTDTLQWLHTQVVDAEDGVSLSAQAWRDLDPDGEHYGVLVQQTREGDAALVSWALQMLDDQHYIVQMMLPLQLLAELDLASVETRIAEQLVEAGRDYLRDSES